VQLTAAVHKPMDVNDVSDYATALEDTLGKLDGDFSRSVTMEEQWRSASERFENTFVNSRFGH
jgi:glycogen debranching enzyme